MRHPQIALLALAVLTACSSETATRTVDPVPDGCLCGPFVSPASANLNIGDRIQFTATTGSQYSASRWRSSNVAVATVDSVTGVATAIGAGSAAIIAAAVKDPTVQGAAALTVSSFEPQAMTVESINEVATGRPANLASLAGDIDVVVSFGRMVSAFNTASLTVNNGVRDTIVATQTLAAGATARWTLRWATASRGSGVAVFPNGQYRLTVAFPSPAGTVSSNHIPVTVVNP